MKLKTIDFATMKNFRDKQKKEEVEKLNKVAKGNKIYHALLKVFNEKYESLTNRKFMYQKRRVRVVEINGNKETTIIGSDAKRLSNIFKTMNELTNSVDSSSKILQDMMDKWSNWDKASPSNLVGFLEKQCKDELGIYFMKLKKRTGKSSILDEEKRTSNVDKHRGYFAAS